jgi:hypothetical protein
MLHGKRLTRRLSSVQTSKIEQWWRGLTAGERRALRSDPGRPAPRVVARFVEPGDPAEGTDDFYEYLVNHEIYLDDGPPLHICTAHPEARAAVRAGHLPLAFQCPRRDLACPMRALLDRRPGHDVRLSLVRAGCS